MNWGVDGFHPIQSFSLPAFPERSALGRAHSLLVFLIYLIAHRVLGFNAEVARATNTFFFATSLVIFYWAIQRPRSKGVALFVVGMMLLSSSFIVQSVYATAISFSLLPAALIFWILARPLTHGSAGWLGLTLVARLFLYPGEFLTGICLALFHAIFFFHSFGRGKPNCFF